MSAAKRLLAACYRGHGMESHAYQLEHERHLVAGPILVGAVHAASRVKSFVPYNGAWCFLLDCFEGRNMTLRVIRPETIPAILDAIGAAQKGVKL